MNDAAATTSRVSIALLVGLAAVAALLIHALSYFPLFVDDGFISLRYAKRLLDGHGLTWTDGEKVEGYSNLLWVLSCAALGRIGMDLVDAARALGVLGAAAAIAALVADFPPRGWRRSLPALAGGLFIALAGPIGIWSIAGLEGCMVAGLLAWAVVLARPLFGGVITRKIAFLPGIPLALLCLTRPDTPLIVATICVLLCLPLWGHSLGTRFFAALGVAALPALATAGQLAFRLLYYDDWLPNTARAKLAFTVRRLDAGVSCLVDAGGSSYALWIPAAIAVWAVARDRERRARIVLPLALVVVWLLYSATIACQPFGYRMLVPCFVLLPFIVAEGIDSLSDSDRKLGGAWGVTLILLLLFTWSQQRDRNIAMARTNVAPLTQQGATIGELLHRAFHDLRPLVAVDAAGVIPYYSDLPSLDMLGLNDAHIARHHTAEFGAGLQGHELGDGDYVLSREPDIVISGIFGGPRLRYIGGKQMEADPRFSAGYRLARFHADEPVPFSFSFYYRSEGKVGVQRSTEQVILPGYMFAQEEGTEARFTPSGELVTIFAKRVVASVNDVDLPQGVWRVEVRGGGPLHLSVWDHPNGARSNSEGPWVEFRHDQPGSIDLSVTGDTQSQLAAVVARRSID